MSTPIKKSGPRLHFLDGLRGLACVYVLLFHASTPHVPNPGELSPSMKFVCAWISQGHFSVVFFIVLSGFSIMLPIARAGDGQLNGGFGSYVYRRARRILPPYYVAIVLSIAMIAGYNVISRRHGLGQPVEDALGAGSVVSHLLLAHNLRFDWAYRINGPLWSVATEWQVYFVFALLVLPLWRRIGNAPTLVLWWLLGSLPFFLLPPDANFFWACPWFLGSFAFGMWGAVIGFSPSHRDSWLRTRMPWGALSLACFAALIALVATGRAASWSLPVVDFVVSLFAFSLINACTDRCLNWPAGKSSVLLRSLGSSTLVYLGGFSYSLYLVQHPVLRLAEKVVGRLPISRNTNIQLHLLVVVPLTIAVAWVFAELFERPFTSGGIVLVTIRRWLRGATPESVKL